VGGEIKIDFNYIDSEWSDIVKEAKKFGIVDGKLESKINGGYLSEFKR
jgi:hypothetical protein